MNKRIILKFFALLLAFVMCVGLASCAIPSDNVTTTTDATTSTSGTTDQNQGDVDLNEDGELSITTLKWIEWMFQNYSIHDVDNKKSLEMAIEAYLYATGDIYSNYWTEEEYLELLIEKSGDFFGIGITAVFNYDEYFIEVVNVIPDSPASKQLVAGDKITHYHDGEKFVSIKEKTLEYIEEYKKDYLNDDIDELIESSSFLSQIYSNYLDGNDTISINEIAFECINSLAGYEVFELALSYIKGPEGTLTEIKVDRNGKELEMELERAKVKSQSVTYRRSQADRSIGIIWISSFDLYTPTQFKNAMDELIAEGVNKFVFDVRENPGGDLASVSAIMSLLLDEGDVIFSTKDSSGKEYVSRVAPVNYEYEPGDLYDYSGCSVAQEDIGKYADYEMIVLTNSNSASAAEIFTAALRDHDKAEIVGEKTYGKGSVQSTYKIPEAYGGGAIKLTTMRYYPPCGEGFDGGIGIQPDHFIELQGKAKEMSHYKLTESIDNQLQKAISLLKY